MPLGEAMFSMRAIRRFRPDAIPEADLRLILEAAVKAPNGGNVQPTRFLVLTDRERIREFGALYHEAWWAKRRDIEGWTKPEDIPADAKVSQSARRLADEIGEAPLEGAAAHPELAGDRAERRIAAPKLREQCAPCEVEQPLLFG